MASLPQMSFRVIEEEKNELLLLLVVSWNKFMLN
jgi:hypothetical protein